MKRALALIAAVAMIGAAFFIRSGNDAGSGVGSADDDVTADTTKPVDTALEVACVEEVQTACGEAGLRSTAGFAQTYDELTTVADPAVDVWVVVDPWPAIIDAERVANGFEPIVGSTIALGSTTFRSYGWTELATASICAEDGKVTMACLRTVDDIPTVGIRDPRRSATGALALAEISAQLGGAASANDLRDLGLSAQTGSYRSPLDAMTLVGQGAFDITVDLSSEAEGLLAGTRVESQISDVLTMAPSVSVVVRIIEIGDDVGDDELTQLAGSLQPALQTFGWASETNVVGPDANSVGNFRSLWEQIAR